MNRARTILVIRHIGDIIRDINSQIRRRKKYAKDYLCPSHKWYPTEADKKDIERMEEEVLNLKLASDEIWEALNKENANEFKAVNSSK